MRKFWVFKTPIDKYLGQEALAIQNKNCLGHSLPTPPPPYVGVKNIISDITSGISDIRAYIVCPQMTQELPKKHHEVGPPEQLPTVALSQIDCRHTRHRADCKEVCLCQWTMQRAFWKIWVGLWLSERWALPPASFQNAPLPLSWERSLKTYQAIEMNYSSSTSLSPICWLICL